MNYNIILAYFILSILVVVKGEFESIQDLPISDLAKKYCSGRRNVDIQFDRENFICHLYDYVDDTGCSHYYDNELIITSFHDECFDGQEIEEGIYNGYQIMFSPECDKKIENMVSYSFTDPNESMYKRSVDISNTVVKSLSKVPLNEPIKSIASKYCIPESVLDIKFNNTDFVCYTNSNFLIYPDCGPQEYIDYRSFITTVTNDCIKGEQLEEGVYSVPATVMNGCDTSFMSEWQYYSIDEFGMLPTPTEVVTPTETVTPTVPVVIGTPTSVDDLPVSDLAKKYCSGRRNVEIRFDSQNFICHMYDSIETSSCAFAYVNELTITSLHDECFDGQKIEEGVYNGYQDIFDNECDKETEKMIYYSFSDPIQPAYKRSINYNDNVVSSFDKVPLNESKRDLVEKYCTEHSVTDFKFNDIDFVCNKNIRLMAVPSCGPQDTTDYRTFISTFTNECLKGEPLEDGIYAIPAKSMNGCDTSFMNEWQYYIVDKVGMFPTPTETVTSTKTVTTETHTVPEVTTSTIIPTITNCLPVTVTLYEKENVTVTSKETVTITNKETVTVTSKETVTVTGEITPTMVVDKQCVKRYGQCGGVGYSGPTCCQSGLTCREMSRYYSRCI